MKFPSREFDDAVAAVCHDAATDEQVQALNELLRHDSAARDEYILRLELHSRLASDPDLFVSDAPASAIPEAPIASSPRSPWSPKAAWAFAVAACITIVAAVGWWKARSMQAALNVEATSRAVAMLHQAVDAQWSVSHENPRLGAPLDPGWLKLEAGWAEIVFYSGARVVIEGPAELQVISPNHAACRGGKIMAEVPPEARGFRVDTPQGVVTDLGTSFGVEVTDGVTELHVFKGRVALQAPNLPGEQLLLEGAGAVIESSGLHRIISANTAAYASLLNLRERSLTADALRLAQWRAASDRLTRDPSLCVRFDFEDAGASPWQLRNGAQGAAQVADATIVGCQFAKGRWPQKRALEFQSVSDRARMSVPGEFETLTLSAWVRVQGLDRKLNSLFMCDGFAAGTVHWLIRNDGALCATIVGQRPSDYQIAISPPVITLEKFGIWLHLAVVIDGPSKRVTHYVNGRAVSESPLQVAPPFRIGPAELGNWNGKGFPQNDPFMIRNFSGAMDEFCLFNRALDAREIHTLYAQGKPETQAERTAHTL